MVNQVVYILFSLFSLLLISLKGTDHSTLKEAFSFNLAQPILRLQPGDWTIPSCHAYSKHILEWTWQDGHSIMNEDEMLLTSKVLRSQTIVGWSTVGALISILRIDSETFKILSRLQKVLSSFARCQSILGENVFFPKHILIFVTGHNHDEVRSGASQTHHSVDGDFVQQYIYLPKNDRYEILNMCPEITVDQIAHTDIVTKDSYLLNLLEVLSNVC
jgi:hypothetical protein